MMLRGAPTCRAARTRRSMRRGLTLIELMLSLTITVMAAGAMSGMMAAVTAGVTDRQDSRTNMIRSHAAESKLSTYVNASRAVWETSATSIALWYDDNRQSDSIHATEIRWIFYDADRKTVEVHFVKFPDEWSPTTRELADLEYQKSASAAMVYRKYVGTGHIASLRLLDNVESISFALDDSDAIDAQRITFTLTLSTGDDPFVITVPTAIAHYKPPLY